MRFLVGKLREEVLVDASEYIAGDLFELGVVQLAQQLAEDFGAQLLILRLRQRALHCLVIVLDGLHRARHMHRQVRACRQGREGDVL